MKRYLSVKAGKGGIHIYLFSSAVHLYKLFNISLSHNRL